MQNSPPSSEYFLRSKTLELSCESDGPKLIPANSGSSKEGVGVSKEQAQEKFLEFVGILEGNYKFTEDILSDSDANLFSTALSHMYYSEEQSDDKHYTREEHARITNGRTAICDNLVAVVSQSLMAGEFPQIRVAALVEQYKSFDVLCQCQAHKVFRRGREESDYLAKLIATDEPLNDHWGVELAQSLLPLILSRGAMVGMSVQPCHAGSPYHVNFILQTPSKTYFHFTGRPDFTVNEKSVNYVLRYTARAVGETQSPPDLKTPGRTNEAKTRALAQAGVYAVGQLSNGPRPATLKSMPAIILFKDKTAQVAIASVDPSKANVDSFGVVSFKFVDSVYPLDLRDPVQLQKFARQFCGCLKIAHTGCHVDRP